MKESKYKKSLTLSLSGGFTLLETIIATGVIVIGLISALTLITNSFFYVSNINDRLIAVNLVEEGIEVVRNVRDNNWLQNLSWNNGLANGSYQAAYNSTSLLPYSGNPLLLNSTTNLYNYISGSATNYVRQISITNISSYEIRIISTVTWQRRGVTYISSAESHLFNWK